MQNFNKKHKPFSLSDRGKESNKKFANKREKSLSKLLNAIQTPNSGSTPFIKGDMLKDNFCIDLKSTKGISIKVTDDMLKRLINDAFRVGKKPILILDFPNSVKLIYKKWVCIPLEEI